MHCSVPSNSLSTSLIRKADGPMDGMVCDDLRMLCPERDSCIRGERVGLWLKVRPKSKLRSGSPVVWAMRASKNRTVNALRSTCSLCSSPVRDHIAFDCR